MDNMFTYLRQVLQHAWKYICGVLERSSSVVKIFFLLNLVQ